MATILIRSGHLLTMDDQLGEVRTGDVLVEDGRISQVGTAVTAPDGAVEIDGSRSIVLPGFVDTHRHMWQTQLRGEMTDATLLDYTAVIRGAYSAATTPKTSTSESSPATSTLSTPESPPSSTTATS
jgi:5-methylthioadenosine/S-adenosylhomocysteine deaminase